MFGQVLLAGLWYNKKNALNQTTSLFQPVRPTLKHLFFYHSQNQINVPEEQRQWRTNSQPQKWLLIRNGLSLSRKACQQRGIRKFVQNPQTVARPSFPTEVGPASKDKGIEERHSDELLLHGKCICNSPGMYA